MSNKTNEKLKIRVLDDPSDQIQKLSKLHFCHDSKNLAEITYFNINTGLKFENKKRVSVQFSQNFKGPSFHCQKFLELKSL